MEAVVESKDRRSADCFNFGVMFFGLIIGVAGVVALSRAAATCGLVLLALGLAYFLRHD
jgi:hypothetical protein